MGRISTFGQHLYEGKLSFDFVGRRKLWYSISLLIVIVATFGFIARGFNLGVEFKGGVEFQAKVATANSQTVTTLTDAVQNSGVAAAKDPTGQTSGNDGIRIVTKALTTDESVKVSKALTKAGASEVSQTLIGPTYGKQVADKSLRGLIVFLII